MLLNNLQPTGQPPQQRIIQFKMSVVSRLRPLWTGEPIWFLLLLRASFFFISLEYIKIQGKHWKICSPWAEFILQMCPVQSTEYIRTSHISSQHLKDAIFPVNIHITGFSWKIRRLSNTGLDIGTVMVSWSWVASVLLGGAEFFSSPEFPPTSQVWIYLATFINLHYLLPYLPGSYR